MKKAWLLTHDNYIDRRIFFFADILIEHGYNIRLFASEYFNFLRKDDPDYVIRPEKCTKVRDYSMFYSEIDEKDRKIVSEINSYQDTFYKRHLRWSKKTPLPLKDVNINVNNHDYTIVISKESALLGYNRSTDNWIGLYPTDFSLDVLNIEEAIKLYLSGIDVKNIEEKYKLEIEEDKYHREIWIHPKESRVLYIYDYNQNILTEYSPQDENNLISDMDLGEKRYEDFRTNVWDFSRILLSVKYKLLEECPDIIYVADLTTLPIAIMLKQKYGCKIIMDCHEWWYKNAILWEPLNVAAQELSNHYEEGLYPKCDLCITVGEYLASRMKEAIGCKFEVIYSCISENLLIDEDNENISLKSKYNLPDMSKIAIFQGGMSTHRNLENLARATKYLDDDCYLLLLTTGEYQETFRSILNEEGNPDRVIWGGWIPQKDLLKFTRNADVGVIPYTAVNDYAECFVPNKLMEYIAARVPILFDESLKELKLVAGSNQVGYGTNLKDASLFGKALNDLLHDDARLDMYKSNFHKCDGVFSYEGQKKSFEKMLKDYKILEEN